MLVATRDPMPHPAGHDASSLRHQGAPGLHPAPKTARFVTALQLAGSLLAIPVGLASAYSIYRANFSVETTCQTLRGNIISMIDKQVDAGTKRMLVRRDVETFEKTCGGVDPDAEAAFKALLAADKVSPPVPAAAPHAVAPAKEVARKAEPHPSVAAKQPSAPAAPVTAAVEPVRHEAAVSDTKWLAAVRGALVSHAPDRTPAAVTPPVAPTPMAEPAPVAATAPALPPPTSVAIVPAQRADPDHPVPPGTIPDANPASDSGARSSWIGKIPFVGQTLAR